MMMTRGLSKKRLFEYISERRHRMVFSMFTQKRVAHLRFFRSLSQSNFPRVYIVVQHLMVRATP